MMTEEGIVEEADGQYATVRLKATGACAACGLCRTAGGDLMLIRALNPVAARPGDRVRVMAGSAAAASGATLLYMIPLGIFIAGALLGHWAAGRLHLAGDPGVVSLAVGVAFIAVYYIALRFRERRRGSDAPTITGFAEAGTSPPDG